MAKKNAAKQDKPSREEIQRRALENAKADRSDANYDAIFEGFMEKGIDEDDIIPRENVFTYDAWQALGRQVRKGEKGVKVVTIIAGTKKDDADNGAQEAKGADDEVKRFKMKRSVAVFHISQTDAIERKEAANG